jgi:hypothetical protein
MVHTTSWCPDNESSRAPDRVKTQPLAGDSNASTNLKYRTPGSREKIKFSTNKGV